MVTKRRKKCLPLKLQTSDGIQQQMEILAATDLKWNVLISYIFRRVEIKLKAEFKLTEY